VPWCRKQSKKKKDRYKKSPGTQALGGRRLTRVLSSDITLAMAALAVLSASLPAGSLPNLSKIQANEKPGAKQYTRERMV
jgi:hypothetical protein